MAKVNRIFFFCFFDQIEIKSNSLHHKIYTNRLFFFLVELILLTYHSFCLSSANTFSQQLKWITHEEVILNRNDNFFFQNCQNNSEKYYCQRVFVPRARARCVIEYCMELSVSQQIVDYTLWKWEGNHKFKWL